MEWVPIGRVHLNPANPRLNDEAVPHVAASIRRFGWQQPIVARFSGEVVAGNTRLKAAMSLGLAEVPVVWFEGSDLEATAYSIADNRVATFARWDEPALAELLEQLRVEDALEGVGYTPADIDELLAQPLRGPTRPSVNGWGVECGSRPLEQARNPVSEHERVARHGQPRPSSAAELPGPRNGGVALLFERQRRC